MDRFLLQVSKDAGYNNIINERLYRNRSWATKPRDKDHGAVEPGDELIVYCTSSVPTYKSSLAFSVMVKRVSPDKITFELDEPQWFPRPLRSEEIVSSVFRNELPDIFRKCGQQGFNIAKIEPEDAQHRETIDRLLRGEYDGSNHWDKLVALAQAYIDTGRLETEEIEYKLEMSQALAAARRAVLSDADDWQSLVRSGIVKKQNIIHFTQLDNFRSWVEQSPNDALSALKVVWTQMDSSVSERIRAFNRVFPTAVTSGSGTRMNVISVLLMALDVYRYPPFRITMFNDAYSQTAYDKPGRNAEEAALYEHALGFLDRFIEESAKRGLNLRHRLDAQSVLWQMSKNNSTISDEEDDEFLEGKGNGSPSADPDLAALARDTYLTAEFLQEIVELLEDKKQVIFQGPPGTGKTYVAQALGECLAGSSSRVTLVQFHPSYAYEDFVQGFRPKQQHNGQPGFELQNGPLLRAASEAIEDPEEKHFLVIDEINRGNLAKVFGELYFLLEYRNKPMDLQYSNTSFSLPDNLYIIGTMNTADRSIALVDLALRRRFHFVEFHPDDEPVRGVLRQYLGTKAPGMNWVANVVERANEILKEDRDAAIGPSYFMKDNLTEDSVQRIWRHNVLPYLKELLYGRDEELKKFDLDALRRGEAPGVARTDNNDESGLPADPPSEPQET